MPPRRCPFAPAEDAAELDTVMEIMKRRYIERLVDQMAMGFILISTAPAKQHAVYDELLKVKEILELYPLVGEYDLIAKIEAEDDDYQPSKPATEAEPSEAEDAEEEDTDFEECKSSDLALAL